MGGRLGGRDGLARTLAALSALVLVLSYAGFYANRAIFSSEGFADRATAALEDDAVSSEVARLVTDDLVLGADRDLVGFAPLIEEAVGGLVSGSAFQSLFRPAVRDVHRALLRRDRDSVTMTIADVGETIRGAVLALDPKVARRVPASSPVDLFLTDPPAAVLDLAQLGDDLTWLAPGLLALGLLGLAASLALASGRRRALMAFGIGLTCSSVAAIAVVAVAHALAAAGISDPDVRAAADALWGAFLGDLRLGLIVTGVCGAIVAAAARSLISPVGLAEPFSRLRDWVVTGPASPRGRGLRGAVLLALGIALLIRRDVVLDVALIALGLLAAYAGAAELMRLALGDEPAAEPGRRRSLRGRLPARRLAPFAVAVILIGVALAAFIGGGGLSVQAGERDRGCNGSRELCAKTLDEVSFAATHNSMSAEGQRGYLFAQQDAPIADQLPDGIRGLLIDAYDGEQVPDGRVRTLIDPDDESTFAKIRDEIGDQAFEAALRLRDRLAPFSGQGERGQFLCHGFCELGALPLVPTLRTVRDFLAANPREVLVIVIEDYVEPDEIAAAVEQSGLIDHVWMGEPGPPWPTLGEMVRSGERVVMMAEHDAGDIPWYHQAFELMQETPFDFGKPSELTDPAEIPASCRANRGPADASLFQINNWIETTPAAKPSNAARVNAYGPLLRRVRECERIRDLTANVIAVDFYGEGDVTGVTDKLNGVGSGD